MKLVMASRNRGKLKELSAILDRFGIEAVLQSDVGCEIDVEETGTTFEENSLLKAHAVFEATGMAAVADDSGLMVDALNGAPGVFSARYGGDACKTDADRNAHLLENMKDIPDEQRTAKFVSVISCVLTDGTVLTARGECPGVILRAGQGSDGFGYDPLFYVPQENATYAELPASRKNEISHRAKAMEEFARQLNEYRMNKEKENADK